jgi:hypothetical protein
MLELGTIDHSVPFQVSTRVSFPDAQAFHIATAVQSVSVIQEIPYRVAFELSLGLGLGMIDHSVPSHDSTNGC